MSRDLERRLTKVETRRRVDDLRGLSDEELVARIADLDRQIVEELRAEIAAGRSEAEIIDEVRTFFARFPDEVASLLGALGIVDPVTLLEKATA